MGYLIELVLRIFVLGRAFFSQVFNVSDAVIVVGSCLETFLMEPLMNKASAGSVNLSVLRIARAFRICRVIRFMRVTENFAELRILVRALITSVRAVVWTMSLIGGIVAAGAILMVQISHVYLSDETLDLEKRRWLFSAFGTTTRSIHTLFECAFTGGWTAYSRPSIEDISIVFAVFWIAYVVLINFTVMRVVSALFLKQTMTVAAYDDERLAMAKLKEKERFARELHEIFQEADESGDGALSKEEFEKMLDNEHVLNHFEKLDLEIYEVIALFGVLSADDDQADYQEFLAGALKMKGSARTIDTVQVLHQQLNLQRSVDTISNRLGIHVQVHPES